MRTSTTAVYEQVAAALASVRASYAPVWDANLFRACDDHAHEFAKRFKAQNPNFSAERFLNAAGVPKARQREV